MRQFTTFGSSYRLDQSPGAERVGGCSVRLRRRSDSAGSIAVERTFHPYARETDHDLSRLQSCIDAPVVGLRESAAGLNVDLTTFDVTVGEFLYIATDSKQTAFLFAGRAAFRAALAARFGDDCWPRESLFLPNELDE